MEIGSSHVYKEERVPHANSDCINYHLNLNTSESEKEVLLIISLDKRPKRGLSSHPT